MTERIEKLANEYQAEGMASKRGSVSGALKAEELAEMMLYARNHSAAEAILMAFNAGYMAGRHSNG